MYFDDIIVLSNSGEDHTRHLDEVLTSLRSAGVSLKLKKCNFFTKTIKYLGHITRPGTLAVKKELPAL